MGRRDEFRFDEHLKNHILEQVLDTPKFKAFYLKNPKYGRMDSCMFLFTPEGVIICGDLCPGNDKRNSGVHAYGYGLEWFAGKLSWDYLCSKFLTQEWHIQLAAEDCRDRAAAIMLGEESFFVRDRELEEVTSERQDLASQIWSARHDIRNQNAQTDSPEELGKVIAHARARGAELRAILLRRRAIHASKYRELADELDNGEMGVETFGSRMYEIDGPNWYECSPGYGYLPRSRYLLAALQKKFSELFHEMSQTVPVGEA